MQIIIWSKVICLFTQIKKHKYFYLAVGILVLVLAFNIITAYRRLIPEPIFLEHYYEGYYEHFYDRFFLEYIDNNNSNKNISNVYFPEVNIKLFAEPYYEYNYNYYTHKIVNFPLAVSKDDIFFDLEKVELNRAIISYTDSSMQEVDLGRIILYREKKEAQGLIPIVSHVGLPKERTENSYEIDGEILVKDIQADLQEQLSDIIDMDVNTLDNSISINMAVLKPDDERKFNVYDICYHMVYKNMGSETYIIPLGPIGYNPFFTEEEIMRYVKDNKYSRKQLLLKEQ